METMYFIFGVLSVIALIAAGAVIYSVVKIFKLKKRLHSLENHVEYFQTDMNDRFKDCHQRIDKLEAEKKLIKG
jgi:cell division protein FtsL